METLLRHRETYGFVSNPNSLIDEAGLLERLGVTTTLEGHQGCVNTLRWNSSGTLLASGSDDQTVRIWSGDGTQLTSIDTGHQANIFCVEFVPYGNDRVIASGAGDYHVKLHDLNHSGGESGATASWETDGRVKRLATAQDEPFLFWSASEDGHIRQYDARTNAEDKLIHAKGNLMIKTFAICQGRTELVAIGVNHPKTWLFDRRKADKPVLTLINGDSVCHPHRLVYTTHVAFDHLGTELIVNQGGGSVYVYNLLDQTEPTVLEKLDNLFKDDREVPVCPSPGPVYSELREKGKLLFREKKYHQAIELYNSVLCSRSATVTPLDRCVLLTNRAMGMLCRRWEGDTYGSIRDNIDALTLNPGHAKALWRLCRALILLEQWKLAADCVALFKRRFPDDKSIDKLEDQVNIGISTESKECGVLEDHPGFRDYAERYSGHTNQHTDIKEANFFGSNNQYIAAGSDDGSLIIWDRTSGSIKTAFNADESILNIVQPHPTKFMMATSGIENVVRLWEPIPEDLTEKRRIKDPWDEFGNRDLDANTPLIRLNDVRRLQAAQLIAAGGDPNCVIS